MAVNALDIYQKINRHRIPNKIDSIYWLFDIESQTDEKNNKIIYRFYLYNRLENVDYHLQKLYYHFNNQPKIADHFHMAKKYNDPHIIYFTLETDEETSCDITFDRYIVKDEDITLSNNTIDYIDIDDDKQKREIIIDKYFKNNEQSFVCCPTITSGYWLCTCGYINQPDTLRCPKCSKKKALVSRISSLKPVDILTDINSIIEINTNETIDTIIENTIANYHDKYQLPKEDIRKAISKDVLTDRQNHLINKEIVNYIQNYPIEYDITISFDDNIDQYCQNITNDIITKDDVLSKLNLKKYQKEYNQLVEKEKRNKRNLKLIGAALAFIIVSLGAIFAVYLLVIKPLDLNNLIKDNSLITTTDNFNLLEDSYVLKENEEKQIEYENLNTHMIFTSKNEKIAFVDQNGLIKGVSVGSTTITINDQGNNKSYTINVTIEKSNSNYIFPGSNLILLTYEDLEALDDEELMIALTEIFARHNCSFYDDNLTHYFEENIEDYDGSGEKALKYDELNDIETLNVNLLATYIYG